MYPKIFDAMLLDVVMPSATHNIMLAFGSINLLLAGWFFIVEIKRRKDWVPLYAFIGGGCIVIAEPLADILFSAFYPVHGAIGYIDLLGRAVPLIIGMNYFWYMALPPIYFLKRLEQGLTTASFWRLYLVVFMFAEAGELLGVNVGAWYYYGPHPFVVFGVPQWVVFVYSGFLVTLCAGLHFMVTNLDRRQHWIIIPGMLFFYVAGFATLSLPTADAMLTTDNPVWIYIGGTASIALTLLLTYVVSQIFCINGKRALAKST